MWELLEPLLTIEWRDVMVAGATALWMAMHNNAPLPPNHPVANGRHVVIRADASGACHASVMVAGHALPVLLDSGATGMPLMFGSNQADDLGIDQSSLIYSHRYQSANGIGREAVITLPAVTLAGWSMHDVEAVITRAPQDEGLFGAQLLHRFNFQAVDGYCTLTVPDEVARIGANHPTAPQRVALSPLAEPRRSTPAHNSPGPGSGGLY
jgi:clan AA aspartic protease (TIGR02281 family)